ncbi:hypothetical protein [Actinobacillus equuli]|uniref:hypothetical protein n=1 Tax=Actinobacillus equuli TaxID=718 RepID=UPI0024420CD2|nr:hypothetical protein [Actinobacillus equuli]WGE85786.1 hypothetical protein NYR87_00810 [Actinobacillus equuli subsp. haemolyticus]
MKIWLGFCALLALNSAYADECLYSLTGKKLKSVQCDVERLEQGIVHGNQYFTDQITINHNRFYVSAYELTYEITGAEYGLISKKMPDKIPDPNKTKTVFFSLDENMQWADHYSYWSCWQKEIGKETICAKTTQ